MTTLAEHVGVGIEDRSKWAEVPLDTLRALELLAARATVVEDLTLRESHINLLALATEHAFS